LDFSTTPDGLDERGASQLFAAPRERNDLGPSEGTFRLEQVS
jgi:hypothetical protein